MIDRLSNRIHTLLFTFCVAHFEQFSVFRMNKKSTHTITTTHKHGDTIEITPPHDEILIQIKKKPSKYNIILSTTQHHTMCSKRHEPQTRKLC